MLTKSIAASEHELPISILARVLKRACSQTARQVKLSHMIQERQNVLDATKKYLTKITKVRTSCY